MIKRAILIFCLFLGILLVPHNTKAQNTSFHIAYGGPDEDHLNCIEKSLDGGYIIGGHTSSYGPHPTLTETNAYLVKTNSLGNVVWNKVFSNAFRSRVVSIISTTDSGYIFLSTNYEPSIFKNDFGVCKIDKDGNIEWNKRYSSSGIDEDIATCFMKDDDGYLVSGYTLQNFDDGREMFLMKIDNNGEVIWTRTYMKAINQGTFTGDLSAPLSLSKTASGDIIIAGRFQNYSSNDNRIILARVDNNGNLKWIKTYKNDVYNTDKVSVKELSDGGYLIGSTAVVQGRELDMILLKTDSIGDFQWCKSYGDSLNETMHDLLIAEDGLIFIGESNSFTPYGQKIYIVKTDFNGNIMYEHLHGAPLTAEYGVSGLLNTDGSLVIGGLYYATKTYEEFFLLKTDKNITLGCEELASNTLTTPIGLPENNYFSEDTIQMNSKDFIMKIDSGVTEHELCYTTSTKEENSLNKNNLMVYPNPFSDMINLSFDKEISSPINIIIINALGEEIYQMNSIEPLSNQVSLEPKLSAGIYFIKVVTEDKSFVVKIISAG